MMQEQVLEKLEVVFVGAPACGKSCLINGYTPDYATTIGVDVARKRFSIDGKTVEFTLWDISASMTFKDTNLDYCKKGQIVACVYDIHDSGSFRDSSILIERLLEEDKMRYDAKIVLVAAKADLQREVSEQETIEASNILKGSQSTPTNNIFEISSKTDPNALQKVCEGIYRIHKDPQIWTVSQLAQQYRPQEAAPSQPTPSSKITIPQKAQAIKVEPRRCRVLLMGDDQCGKSAMMWKYTKDQFTGKYEPTIGVDFETKMLDVDGENIKLMIWDTAGLKKFQTISACYIKNMQTIFIVFDCTNPQSFANIQSHMQSIAKCHENPSKLQKYLIANKIDLNRIISKEEGQQLANIHGCHYREVSAAMGIGLRELFQEAVWEQVGLQGGAGL